MNEFLTIVSPLISFVVVVISMIINRNSSKKSHLLAEKANKLMEEANRIQAGHKYPRWYDIERYVSVIVQQMNKDGFAPTCIYATSTHHAHVAAMIGCRLFTDLNIPTIPIYVGISIGSSTVKPRKGYDVLKLGDWGNIFIPMNLPIIKSDRILIVRAHFGSGIGVSPVIDYFSKKYNINKDNLKTACIAYPNDIPFNPPDYSCLAISGDIWFPWGKNL